VNLSLARVTVAAFPSRNQHWSSRLQWKTGVGLKKTRLVWWSLYCQRTTRFKTYKKQSSAERPLT